MSPVDSFMNSGYPIGIAILVVSYIISKMWSSRYDK